MKNFKFLYKIFTVFSFFSISSLIILMISTLLILFGYVGIIEPTGKIVHIANEVVANETGVSIEEIEEIEGIKIKK